MANINEYSYENVGFNSNLMRAPESDGALIAATSGRDDLLKAEVTTQIQKSKEIDIDEATYFKIISNKTASLMSLRS